MNNPIDILKNFTVLCVEDEVDVREELAQFLKRRVKKLYLASNGVEGLALFQEHAPDIVITDILMPIMNGLDMTKAIKLINPDVPIIVTTAFNDPDFFLRAIEIGVSKYVLKPVEIRPFLDSLNEVAWLLRAQRELRISATVFNASAEAILITDDRNSIISVNPAFSLITGYEHDEIIGKNPKILSSGRQDSAFYKMMWEKLQLKHTWQGEIWNRRKNGEIYPEWLSLSLVTDANNMPLYHVAIFSDMTMRKSAEQRLYHLAHFDPLTNLPNRTLLQDRLHQAVSQAARSKTPLALIFIDLDRFKYVNDTFGHLIGDLLLQEVSRRLKSCVRVSDTVSRIGGDEFVILLPQVHDSNGAAKVARLILKHLTSLFLLQEHEVHIGGSIGIAMYPDNGSDVETLMKSADSAMYAVKEAGRNNFQFFQSEMNDRLQERLSMENTFVTALNNNQFELLYQPMFDPSEEVIGVEALLRWNQSSGKVLKPADFLPLAEETGFILQLGKWVLKTALSQIKSQQQNSGCKNLKVAINVSAKQLGSHGFSEYISGLLKEFQFDPHCLELEISEKALINATESIFFVLNHLHNLGISIVVDDFGMGYASLLHLSTLPIERLKIDRSLMANTETSGKDAFAIVSAIIAMANSLSLKITMGGLENLQQANLIRSCENLNMQGYHLCYPLTVSELTAELRCHAIHE
ncbi:MAG: EAL domain-containing protein [Methylococcales bacterium]|nr:EAL domain-containing protein [Methylococcales bacterium]MDD5753387.1 EAL domain-containing protein [Methylococcales bacterium]